jgi:hypothetical protein
MIWFERIQVRIYSIHFRVVREQGPMRIRVGISPQHPLSCRKRRLNGAVLVLPIRPEKLRSVSQQVWHNFKDPYLPEVPERQASRSKICKPSSAMVTSITAHFVANLRQSVPQWPVYFVSNCIATKCASIATSHCAYFVATRGWAQWDEKYDPLCRMRQCVPVQQNVP